MLRRDVTLISTPAFTAVKHSTGTTITDRFTGKDVYLQPGDDENTFLNTLELMEENETDTVENCNNLCATYFD